MYKNYLIVLKLYVKCNLVPRAFSSKNFFEGKALGTRLREMIIIGLVREEEANRVANKSVYIREGYALRKSLK